MKIKTSELTGPALDWAVELAKGTHWSINGYFCFDNPRRYDQRPEWRYSTNWSQGGPIIEREGIAIDQNPSVSGEWLAVKRHGLPWNQYLGPTALIAAMRCFAASKLGDEVDVPKELLE